MALSDFDAKVLKNLTEAEFVVENLGQRIMIAYAHLTGEVFLNSDTGIVYGEYGNMTEWAVAEGDCTGAMNWAVKETQKRMRATADSVIAKLTAQSAA